MPEFFQQSHFPILGCPKALQVSIIENELNLSMSEIQKLILALSAMHQISASITSLPLPIYVAHETAKRGLHIYNELYDLRFPKNPQNQISFAPELKTQDRIFNYGKKNGAFNVNSFNFRSID